MGVGQPSLPLPQPLAATAVDRPLADQVAIVAGASSEIVRAAAVALAQGGAGVGLLGHGRQLLEQVAAEVRQVRGTG